MAGYKSITLTKRDLPTPVLQLVHGDRETSGLRLNINRYDGGVDLSTLGWSISVVNADEDSDIIMFTPDVTDMWIVYDWDIPAICTAETGDTSFSVMAVNANEEKVWQSGIRVIQVEEGLTATPGYDPEELSIFQQTVSTVGVTVVEMEDTLSEFEDRMETAEATVEQATASANAASAAAESAAQTSQAAVTAANNATSQATSAATSANTAAANATQIYNTVRSAYESGEFKGEQGDPGQPGQPGQPGYTPQRGVDYMNAADIQQINSYIDQSVEDVIEFENVTSIEAPDMEDFSRLEGEIDDHVDDATIHKTATERTVLGNISYSGGGAGQAYKYNYTSSTESGTAVFTNSKWLSLDNGKYQDTSSSAYASTEEYYKLVDGCTLFTGFENSELQLNGYIHFYDKNKSWLGYENRYQNAKDVDYGRFHGWNIPIPAGARYIRMCLNGKNSWNTFVYGTQTDPIVLSVDRIKSYPLCDKTILVLGDSLFGNHQTDGAAVHLASMSKATVINGAIGGTRLDGDRDQYSGVDYIPFDGLNLINAITSGTWTEQDAHVDNVSSYVKTATLPALKDVDLTSVDIVILNYGTNDYTADANITPAKMKANIKSMVSKILEVNPKIRILCNTLMWRMFGDVDGDAYTNVGNYTLRDYADGIIDGCKFAHISSLDALQEMPLNQYTMSTYMDSDKCHINGEGSKLYAQIIYGKLRTMFGE